MVSIEKKLVVTAVATKVRTLESKGAWGLCLQPGVPPLHPVPTNLFMAIENYLSRHQALKKNN
jgi:hypothetical protein